MQKLKIGLVLDTTLDKPDGVQQVVQVLGQWLSSQGHEVHYLVGESHRTDYPNVHSLAKNVHIRFNGNRLDIPLPASRKKIKQLLDELDLDVLHVQTPHSPAMAQRVVLAASPETAVVATFHVLPNSRLAEHGTTLLGLLLRPSLKRIQVVFAVSPAAKVFADRRFGITCEVLPNPIKLAQFSGKKPYRKYADKPTIVYLNRLVPRKGAIHLLRAVAYLRDHQLYDQPFRVLVCGKGEETPRLQRFIEQHQLQDVITLTGYVSEEDKPHYLASSDVTVYPSTGGESFGIVLLEGMAASNGPVIAGNNPGYASVMEPRPEQLIDPYNTPVFAAKLAAYLKDPAARKEAVAWQKEYVKQFDINVVGAKLLTTYSEALRKRRLQ